MGTKFSEDVIPLTDLKINPGRIVKHATDAHRPVLLTRRGRGVAECSVSQPNRWTGAWCR